MDALLQLVLLYVLACARGEPLGDALRRRSSYGVYASDFSGDYEPYMFAAIPLHAPVPVPVPVLRVVSAAPLAGRDRKHAPSVHHPVYARAPYTDTEYGSEYEAGSYEPQQYSSGQYGAVPYAKKYQSSQLYAAASSTPEEPTILYARASPHGGYTYHSAPSKSGKRAHAAAAAAAAPYIIRVHKYRIVKER